MRCCPAFEKDCIAPYSVELGDFLPIPMVRNPVALPATNFQALTLRACRTPSTCWQERDEALAFT